MIAVVDPDRHFRSRLAQELGGSGGMIEAAGVQDLERLLGARPGQVEVAVLGPNLPADVALRTADWMQAQAPEVSVLMVASEISSDFLHAALRSGVKDVLPLSFTPDQVREAIDRGERLSRQIRGLAGPGEPARRSSHKLVTVFSSKGGAGKSVVASNLAILLAQQTRQEVALVDLDLQSGDLAIMLQVLPAWTIYDAASHTGRLDMEALRGYLTPHSSGIKLLSAPLDPALAEAVSADSVHRILRLLKESYPHVVVDGPAYFTDQLLAALDESDECVLLASMDVPSIKNFKLALQTLEQLGFGRERIKLVLNRADSRVGLTLGEVEKTLGSRIDVAIPSSREVPLSVNQGTPLAVGRQRSAVVKALSGLAEAVRARPQPQSEWFQAGSPKA